MGAIATALVLVLAQDPVSGLGAAQEPAVPAQAIEEVKVSRVPGRWYGWQTAMTDVAALGMSALISPSQDRTPAIIGASVLYLAGAPSVHLLHENYGRAAASLGLRVGAPAVGGLGLGLLGGATGNAWGAYGGALLGTGLGVLYAMVSDAMWRP